jgi:DNA-binding HxlR family transcriptional regulator
MDMEKLAGGRCPVGRALARVGDGWSLLILRDAGLGATRFDQFRASLGIAPSILARRLAALTDAGLLVKRRYSERPPRDEYLLTEAGRDFLPVLHAIGAWGARHHGQGEVSRLVDTVTGAQVDPVVVDAASGIPLRDRKLKPVAPDAGTRRRSWLL